MATALANVVPSHLQDRSLYPFQTLRATGLPDAAGDKAFDEDEDGCAAPPGSAEAPAAALRWLRPD